LVIQSDAFLALPSVTVLRLSSDVVLTHLARITVDPTPSNGLRATSQVMIYKAVAVPREKVGRVIGRLDDDAMRMVERALANFLGLGE
jgi:mRNA interferase MazF